jgi:type IV secretion system protein VirB11
MKPDSSLSVRLLLDKYGIAEALKGDITEFAINDPMGFWTESSKGWQYFENSSLTLPNLQGLAIAMAVFNQKKLDRDSAVASLTLPEGERCQVVMPPVSETGKVSFTIRNPSSSRFSLSDYASTNRLKPSLSLLRDSIDDWESELMVLASKGDFEQFFTLAVKHKLNVVTVGGTGSGKTTFSKTLIDLYPPETRIFTVEDAHELTTPLHRNSVHLFFSEPYPAKVVLASCMRMKPDNIFLTELRGDESWDYLMALKSGHGGSVTSIHANDCRGAMYKIGSYIKQSEVGRTLDMSFIMREVETIIDVVAFFEKSYLKELYYDPIHKLKLLKGD